MDGVILAFKVPTDLARRLELPMADAEDAAEMHITLMLLGNAKDIESKRQELESLLKSWSASHASISGELGGVARFAATPDSDGKEPLVVLFDSPDLPAWREGLFKQVNALLDIKDDQTHGFTPHITIKYLAPDEGSPVMQVKREEVTFPSLWLFWGDEQVKFLLTGTKKESKMTDSIHSREAAIPEDVNRAYTLISQAVDLLYATRDPMVLAKIRSIVGRIDDAAHELLAAFHFSESRTSEADASALYDKLRTLNSLLVGLPVSVPPESLKDPKVKRLLSGAKATVMDASKAVDALADYVMGLDTDLLFTLPPAGVSGPGEVLPGESGLAGFAESVRESTLTGSQKSVIKSKIDSAIRSTLDAMGDLEADPNLSQVKATLDRAAKMLQSVSSRGIEAVQELKARELTHVAAEWVSVSKLRLLARRLSEDDDETVADAGDKMLDLLKEIDALYNVFYSAGRNLETESRIDPLQHFVEAGVLKSAKE